MTTSKKTIQES